MNAEQRLTKIERKLAHALKLLSMINTKYKNLIAMRKHYMRTRKAQVDKRETLLLARAQRVAKILSEFPQFQISSLCKPNSKGRIVLLVTPAQADKLRAITEFDFRAFNSRPKSADNQYVPFGKK